MNFHIKIGILGKKSQSFTEYVILLSIVMAAVIGMRVYAKRAIQARIKDLTDALIAPRSEHLEHVNEMEPLLDTTNPNLKKLTAGESHMEIKLKEDPTAITTTKGKAPGYQYAYTSNTAYMTIDDPTKDIDAAAIAAQHNLSYGGVVHTGVTTGGN